MSPSNLLATVAVAALVICPVASRADNSEGVDVLQDAAIPDVDRDAFFSQITKLRPRVDFGTRAMFDGDFGSGDVDWVQSYGIVALPIPVSEEFLLIPSVSGGIGNYDFGGDPSFLDAGQTPGSDPFDDLYHTQIRLNGRYLLNEDWSILGGLWVSGQWEDGAQFSDAMRFGGLIGASHQLTESISLTGGVAISEKFDSGVKFSPFLGGSWRVNDWLRLQTEGLGLRAEAKVNDAFRVFAFGGYRSRRYLLDERNDGPNGVGEGWIRDRRLPIGAGLEWRITKTYRLHIDAGAIIEQKFRVIDEDDDEFDSVSLDDPAPFASIRLEARF